MTLLVTLLHKSNQPRMAGKGVPKDYVLSHMWLNIAKANANADADADAVNKDSTLLLDIVAIEMTARQIAEAQELARKCTANKFKGC